MPTPSPVIAPFMRPFASAFTRPTFEHVLTLIGGTLLTSGAVRSRPLYVWLA